MHTDKKPCLVLFVFIQVHSWLKFFAPKHFYRVNPWPIFLPQIPFVAPF